MRGTVLAILVAGLVCSVSAAEGDEEPRLFIRAKLSVVNVGEMKGIFCEGTNLEEPMEWYSPTNKKINPKTSTNTRVYVEKYEEKRSLALIIKVAEVKDSGIWTCKSGDLNSTIEIVVGAKVQMNTSLQIVEADEGKNVKLSCTAKGVPPPTVQWYIDGVAILEDHPHKYVMSSQRDEIFTLEVKNLNHLDTGDYECKVTQKALSHYADKHFNLIVHHKPIIVNPDTNQTESTRSKVIETFAVIGDVKNLTCTMIAIPLPKFQWVRIRNSYESKITDEDLIIPSESGMSSTYMLRMRDESDKGQYKCTASNNKGSTSIIFDVSPGEMPSPPDSIKLEKAEGFNLTFEVVCSNCTMASGEPAPLDPMNLPVDAFVFELVPYREGYPANWDGAAQRVVPITSSNQTSFLVPDLVNATTYEVRVRSRNLAGFSDWLVMDERPTTTNYGFRLAINLWVITVAYLLVWCY